jgi:hypothetical protein
VEPTQLGQIELVLSLDTSHNTNRVYKVSLVVFLCVGFINTVGVVAGARRAQLNRIHLKTEAESSLRNVVFQLKESMMDNVQNCDSYIFCYTLPQTLGKFGKSKVAILN